ncbi:DUF4198 domain-containing protein [[Pseudomonas] carboxydohydrogena]|uniref:DUF4198 domain-containing protein n=1 Tax=Afipia carboxydohydrogena TaxID=290 RepID=A0ABY8BQS6_AFICR|nr:DUF4198 domain-containing protein [[Pseudomonas] carboxydohydrogena]WEF51306.1 DUF4198 domain-containing protein [[Pseudomonas] carboxydohydrogena]
MTKHLKVALIAASVSLLALPAQAHRAWLLPSATVLSGADAWITVDAAISNDLFYFEHHPMQLDNLSIEGPDGKTVAPENLAKGRYRSTFDVKLAQPGTYKLTVMNQGVFASYKMDGQTKRWRGKAADLEKAIPGNATDVKISESHSRVESFVTSGKPSTDTLKAIGTGLEMIPVTHPNNLVAGEKATFRLMLDGQPASGVEVAVVPGGIRYRDKLNDSKVTTDASGTFSVTWPGPGFYWMSASVSDDKSKIKNAQRRSNYSTTIEVLPQ